MPNENVQRAQTLLFRAKARLAPAKSGQDALDCQKNAKKNALAILLSLCLHALTCPDRLWIWGLPR